MVTKETWGHCNASSVKSLCFLRALTGSQTNNTDDSAEDGVWTDPFIKPLLKNTLISSYVTVFLLCFFGSVVVLYVITVSSRMRTRTNLFLANLAVADLCVGIFCILPSLHRLLYQRWYLGQALCKIHKFTENMNLSASMLLLVMMALERFIAINYPLRAKRFFTQYKMYFAQCLVWLVSGAYSAPNLYFYHAVVDHHKNLTSTFCMYKHSLYRAMEIYYQCTFVVWYLAPLVILTVLYTKIALTLWKSDVSNQMVALRRRIGSVASSSFSEDTVEVSSMSNSHPLPQRPSSLPNADSMKYEVPDEMPIKPNSGQAKLCQQSGTSSSKDPRKKRTWYAKQTRRSDVRQLPVRYSTPKMSLPCSPDSSENISLEEADTALGDVKSCLRRHERTTDKATPADSRGRITEPRHSNSSLGTNLCRYRVMSQKASRRRVIILLLAVLITFAVLTLPFHIKRLQTTFDMELSGTDTNAFFSLLCPLLTYFNSAMNPILYCLLSQSFRRGLTEAMSCLCFRVRRKQPRSANNKSNLSAAVNRKRASY